MIVKSRQKSGELLILDSLNKRMELNEKYKSRLYTLQKGYEGEVLFESYIAKQQSCCLVLSDLFLLSNSTHFQLDSIIITLDKIHLFEVKNIEGDYYYDTTTDRISSVTKEILNPLSQVVRAEMLLRQLLQVHNIHLPIDYNVVFINPEFMLYNAPSNKPFIFPTQVNRYLKQFSNKALDNPNKNRHVAEKLLSLHTSDSKFWQIPAYEYGDLKKGVTCEICRSFMIRAEGQSCVCERCGYRELVSSAVMRSVEELKLLFPEEKITTNLVFDWCRGIVSKKTIYRILKRNLEIVGINRWVSYE
ncbi:Nuclease-like protein OS=Ureibacillus acetophenoni OX=614649 GN=SAMN05877842_101412 PE=4 SV=1 [Ureibacillus acetophenoni]